MTQTEYDKAKEDCWIAVKKELDLHYWGGPTLDIVSSTFDHAYVLGKQDKDADTAIQGWVARDEEGYISLFPDKPERDMYDCNDVTYGFWDEANGHHIELPTDSFPSVTWQSEPKRVRITIEEIEE